VNQPLLGDVGVNRFATDQKLAALSVHLVPADLDRVQSPFPAPSRHGLNMEVQQDGNSLRRTNFRGGFSGAPSVTKSIFQERL
jgi:hypothetical protein